MQGRGIYSTTTTRCNDDKRFQLTVRINREKLAVELEIRSTSAKRTISLESIFLEERGWKERERGKKTLRERSLEKFVSSLLTAKG